ncbi:MAG: hypothetical protein Ct9H300mP31_04880 [Acidimicrobiaceae bacterium]|nr:MAG: hypothetical protein Ct9H300mP31_04880 [Acidimicrobiaceae bacterium]
MRHGVVALTKVGPADDDLVDLAHLEVEERVGGHVPGRRAGSQHRRPDRGGVGQPTGRPLGDLLAATPTAVDHGRPRLWIDRAFSARGAGTVVTGTLTGGRLHTDDELAVHPAGSPVRVRFPCRTTMPNATSYPRAAGARSTWLG